MTSERMEVQRTIHADPAAIFRVLCDPHGHVAIDSSGMLMDATGEPVKAVGDEFVVHMDREALNDYPMGEYDVTVTIKTFVPDREIAWTILGQIRPQIGHVYGYTLEPTADGTLVTSYYDWSPIDPVWKEAKIFPVISEGALRATLGILARTVAGQTGRAGQGRAGQGRVRSGRKERIARGYARRSVPAGTKAPARGAVGVRHPLRHSRVLGRVRRLPVLAGPTFAAGNLGGLVQLRGRCTTSVVEHGVLGRFAPAARAAPLEAHRHADVVRHRPDRASPFSLGGSSPSRSAASPASGWRRVLATSVVLAFACTLQVSEWDWSILSESLALASLAAIFAFSIRFVRTTSRRDVAGLLVASVAFALARDEDIWTIAFMGFAALAVSIVLLLLERRETSRRSRW